jgi:hypothetical protein
MRKEYDIFDEVHRSRHDHKHTGKKKDNTVLKSKIN